MNKNKLDQFDPTSKPKTLTMLVRFPEPVKKAVFAKAASLRLSVSKYMLWLVIKDLNKGE